jgi:hypothetical protein
MMSEEATKIWVSKLLTATQLLETNVDPATCMGQLKVDLRTAPPLTVDPMEDQQLKDLNHCFRTLRQRIWKGKRIYIYYRIYLNVLELRLTKTAAKVRADVKKISKSNTDRHYRIATRVGQLMDALGAPYYRSFGILTPQAVFQMKKKDWDNLCDYATTLPTPGVIVDEVLLHE